MVTPMRPDSRQLSQNLPTSSLHTHRMVSQSVPSGTDQHNVQVVSRPTNNGIAEASRQLATQPDLVTTAHPTHGIAERPERYQPVPVCKTYPNPD